MKLLKLLPFVLLTLGFVACGDDEDENVSTNKTGTFTTLANGIRYAEDNVLAEVSLQADEGKLTIVLDTITARPAYGETPAQVMTSFTLSGITYEEADGKYSFDANIGEEAFGTMGDAVKACKKCHVTGTLGGNKLFFTTEYKFSESAMEPLLSSTYTGTCRRKGE